MDDDWRVLRDAALAIEDQRIAAIGSWSDLRAEFPDTTVIGDGTGMLIPGMVNAHTHFSEGLLPSLGDGMNLYEWGLRVIIPAGARLDREKARIGTLIKGIELLNSGVTTVNDMFVHSNPGSLASLGVVDAVEQLGMRAVVCFGAEDVSFANPDNTRMLTIDEVLEEHQALANRAATAHRIGFRVGIGTLSGQTIDLLTQSIDLAHRNNWGIHTHLAEIREEDTYFRTTFGLTPTAYAVHHGLLELDVIAGHCIWLNETDLDHVRRAGVHVVHNTIANMILGSGVCAVPRMLHEGINVSLGTDGAASNNNQNMFQLMKSAALLQRITHLNASVITARDVCWMATRGGARALGLEEEIGSLEVGKQADIVLLDGNTATLAPTHDPYGQLVFSATGREVSSVWVAGTRVVQEGRVIAVNEATIAHRAREAAIDLVAQVPALQSLSLLHTPSA
jgi:cytosine/adenosine deaminase-related metal-dependent hydrolase